MFPTLANMPSAIAHSALIAEPRLAAILHRQMHLALPATLEKHSAVLMKLLLVAELAFLGFRAILSVVEFLFIETAQAALTPFGAMLLACAAALTLAEELSTSSVALAVLMGVLAFASWEGKSNIPTYQRDRHEV